MIAILMQEVRLFYYAKMGHKVKFVSLTNGDAGHYAKGGGALAKIRIAEAQEAGKTIWSGVYSLG